MLFKDNIEMNHIKKYSHTRKRVKNKIIFSIYVFIILMLILFFLYQWSFKVEQMIVRMAQTGQIGGKLDDSQLIQLLESLNQQIPKSTSKVNFDRRRVHLDSDDEEEDYGI